MSDAGLTGRYSHHACLVFQTNLQSQCKMPTQIFPKEILERTTEYHLSRHRSSTQVVYITILLALLVAIAILPFLNVDVSVKSQGLLKPLRRSVPSKPPPQA